MIALFFLKRLSRKNDNSIVFPFAFHMTVQHIRFKIFCLHRFIENVYNHTSDATIVVRANRKIKQFVSF